MSTFISVNLHFQLNILFQYDTHIFNLFQENEVILQEGTFEQDRRELSQHHNTVQQNKIIYDIQN